MVCMCLHEIMLFKPEQIDSNLFKKFPVASLLYKKLVNEFRSNHVKMFLPKQVQRIGHQNLGNEMEPSQTKIRLEDKNTSLGLS